MVGKFKFVVTPVGLLLTFNFLLRMNKSYLQFIYAYPLDIEFRQRFDAESKEYPSISEVRDTLQRWQELWQTVEEEYDILALLSELTNRTPTRALECFVFGDGLRAKSTPFLMPVINGIGKRWSDERFTEIIIHELLHIYLTTDNVRYWEYAVQQYADEESATLHHVLLYAMLYEVFQRCFNIEPGDFRRNNLPPGYQRAIDIVRTEGHQSIIQTYVSLQKTS